MARTAAAARLTEQHRAGQLRIRAKTLQDFTRLWPLWRGDEASFRNLVEATVPLVRLNHGLSSSFASAYYEAFRRREQVGGSPALRVAEPLPEQRVVASLFVTGSVMTRKAITAGHSPQAAMQTALTRVSGAVTRHVLDGGRDTLLLSAAEDRQAEGMTRVTGGNPCAFCATLASRGPVYGAETSDFEAHDHCACTGEVTYEGSEWPGRARDFQRLYNEVAAGAENPIDEMRKALAAGR